MELSDWSTVSADVVLLLLLDVAVFKFDACVQLSFSSTTEHSFVEIIISFVCSFAVFGFDSLLP